VSILRTIWTRVAISKSVNVFVVVRICLLTRICCYTGNTKLGWTDGADRRTAGQYDLHSRQRQRVSDRHSSHGGIQGLYCCLILDKYLLICFFYSMINKETLHDVMTQFIRSNPPSRPNKAGLNVRPYFHQSTESFSSLNKIWFSGRGRWVIHDSIPYDPIQGQGQLVKVTKSSKSIASASMSVIKRLMVNHDTPRQYLNFNWTDFRYSFSFDVTWPTNLGCPALTNEFCLLRAVDRLTRMGLVYLWKRFKLP